MATRSRFLVDGTELNIPGLRWVNDSQKMHAPSAVDIPSVKLPGRNGEVAIPSARTFGAATWTLDVSIGAQTYPQVWAAKAALESLLTPTGRLVTLREAGADLDVQASAILTGASEPALWSSLEPGVDLTYTFTIPSGVWEDATAKSLVVTRAGTVSVPGFAGGSAAQQGLTVSLTTSSTEPLLRLVTPGDPGSWLTFATTRGLVTSGTIVTITPSTLTARTSAGVDLSRFVDVGASPVYLPQSGVIVVGAITGISSATITARRAWY